MRAKLILFISAVLILCSLTNAKTSFNDGAFHLIDYTIDDSVYVDEGMPGVGTRIEVTSTGAIGPGMAYGYIAAYGNSNVTISGGTLGWALWCYDYSTATVKKSSHIQGGLVSTGNSVLNFQGGTIGESTAAIDQSVMYISGGSIGSSFELRDQAQVFWSGGIDSGKIMSGSASRTPDSCLLTCIGSNFAVNGVSVGYGQSVSAYASAGTYSGLPCMTGYITGTLANGDRLNNSFYIFTGSDIVVVPEPATLLILGLGAVALRKRKV